MGVEYSVVDWKTQLTEGPLGDSFDAAEPKEPRQNNS